MIKLAIDREVTAEKLSGIAQMSEKSRARMLEGPGDTMLVMDEDGRTFAGLAIYPMTGGLYDCYLLPTELMKTEKVAIARIIKKELESVLSKLDWKIVRTASKDDRIVNRFMEFMDFVKQEPVTEPCGGEKHFMWRKFNG